MVGNRLSYKNELGHLKGPRKAFVTLIQLYFSSTAMLAIVRLFYVVLFTAAAVVQLSELPQKSYLLDYFKPSIPCHHSLIHAAIDDKTRRI